MTEEFDYNWMKFEEWISEIESGKKKFFTNIDIKKLIKEAGTKFGMANKKRLETGD